MIQLILLGLGLIMLLFAGYQDYKTHKPTILIPALITIGFSINLLTGFVIGLLAFISVYGLPNKINNYFGKADVFLVTSLAVLMVMFKSQLVIQVILFASIITIPLMFIYMKKKPDALLPYVGLFVTGFFISSTIFLIVMLAGVI